MTASVAPTAEALTTTKGTTSFAHALMCLVAAKDVQSINHMQHGIAVDAVVFRVAALHGINRSAEVALIVQDVVELQRQCEVALFQQTLRQLHVPHQLVGVHGLVVVATTTVLVQVGRQAGSPRSRQVHVDAVGKTPCVQIALFLQLVARVVIVHRSIQLYFQPFVAEAHPQTLVNR